MSTFSKLTGAVICIWLLVPKEEWFENGWRDQSGSQVKPTESATRINNDLDLPIDEDFMRREDEELLALIRIKQKQPDATQTHGPGHKLPSSETDPQQTWNRRRNWIHAQIQATRREPEGTVMRLEADRLADWLRDSPSQK